MNVFEIPSGGRIDSAFLYVHVQKLIEFSLKDFFFKVILRKGSELLGFFPADFNSLILPILFLYDFAI